MKLSKKTQLQEQSRQLISDLITAKAEIAEQDLTIEELADALAEESALGYNFVSAIALAYGNRATDQDMVGDLPRLIQEKLNELDSIKIRIRRFTWELK